MSITDREASLYYVHKTDKTSFNADLGQLARWAYEKGYNAVTKMHNDHLIDAYGYIKPKFKVGDKVHCVHDVDTITGVKIFYALNYSGEYCWPENELTEYNEKSFKVGDKTKYGEIISIYNDEVWIDSGEEGCSTYYIKDL